MILDPWNQQIMNRSIRLIWLITFLVIHQSLLRHKLAHNGGFSDSELLLLFQNSSYVGPILFRGGRGQGFMDRGFWTKLGMDY